MEDSVLCAWPAKIRLGTSRQCRGCQDRISGGGYTRVGRDVSNIISLIILALYFCSPHSVWGGVEGSKPFVPDLHRLATLGVLFCLVHIDRVSCDHTDKSGYWAERPGWFLLWRKQQQDTQWDGERTSRHWPCMLTKMPSAMLVRVPGWGIRLLAANLSVSWDWPFSFGE